ncbi:MAG: HAMP domain-containing protein, partial [Alphaproteobacteria bacterium]
MSDEESTMAQSVKAAQENETLAPVSVRFPQDTDVRRRGGGYNRDDDDDDDDRHRRDRGNNDNDNDNDRRRRDRADDDNDRDQRLRLRFPKDDRIEISQAILPVGWISVRFEAPDDEPFALNMLLAALLAAILTSMAAAWLAGRVSRPISALAGAADDVARGQTPPYLEPHGPDDLRRATIAFNT